MRSHDNSARSVDLYGSGKQQLLDVFLGSSSWSSSSYTHSIVGKEIESSTGLMLSRRLSMSMELFRRLLHRWKHDGSTSVCESPFIVLFRYSGSGRRSVKSLNACDAGPLRMLLYATALEGDDVPAELFLVAFMVIDCRTWKIMWEFSTKVLTVFRIFFACRHDFCKSSATHYSSTSFFVGCQPTFHGEHAHVSERTQIWLWSLRQLNLLIEINHLFVHVIDVCLCVLVHGVTLRAIRHFAS